MDVVLCIRMSTSASVDLVDENGKVVCSETIQQAGCFAVLKQLIEETAPKLMRRSQSQIVAASIAMQGNNTSDRNIGRYLRNDLHANLGVRAFRVCEHNEIPLKDFAKATWKLV